MSLGGILPLNKSLLDTDIFSEVLKAVDPNVARNASAYRKVHGVVTLSTYSATRIPTCTDELANMMVALAKAFADRRSASKSNIDHG